MSGSVNVIALSLISHTNAGKTTLARTLLGRDVGEVRDAPHVTTEVTPYTLIGTPEGDTLVLWDTPGFGDSVRLAQRLAQQGNPIGWFLSQVWDRFRDRPFYLSQKAMRHVRDDADLVLYVVNASEMPTDAGYLAPELDVLAWLGRPTFVLLNQMGRPRPRVEEEVEEARWREAMGARPFVHGVLTLDAFARCWVQEVVLLRVLAPAIAAEKQIAYERLVVAWQARRNAQFEEAMATLATPISRAASDKVTLPNPGFWDAITGIFRSVIGGHKENEDKQQAARELAERLDAGLRESTDRLIAIHDLEGRAADEVRERLVGVRIDAPMHEGNVALLGGVVSGALSGLAADLVAGGLTFGTGTLLGAIAGALGGAGLARGFNVIRGRSESEVRWDDELLDGLVASALLRYLAVAHFGRGRGEWKESECPQFWHELVKQAIDTHRAALAALWAQRADAADHTNIEAGLRAILGEAARTVLEKLYPSATTVTKPAI